MIKKQKKTRCSSSMYDSVTSVLIGTHGWMGRLDGDSRTRTKQRDKSVYVPSVLPKVSKTLGWKWTLRYLFGLERIVWSTFYQAHTPQEKSNIKQYICNIDIIHAYHM